MTFPSRIVQATLAKFRTSRDVVVHFVSFIRQQRSFFSIIVAKTDKYPYPGGCSCYKVAAVQVPRGVLSSFRRGILVTRGHLSCKQILGCQSIFQLPRGRATPGISPVTLPTSAKFRCSAALP